MEDARWLDYAVASRFRQVSAADVTVYPDSHELFIAGRNARCPRAQLQLLTILLAHFCQTVSYHELSSANGQGDLSHNLLHVHLCYLRRLLRTHRAQLEIRNIYGTGYQARPKRV